MCVYTHNFPCLKTLQQKKLSFAIVIKRLNAKSKERSGKYVYNIEHAVEKKG